MAIGLNVNDKRVAAKVPADALALVNALFATTGKRPPSLPSHA